MATKPATRRYSVKKSTGHFSTVAQKQRAHDAYVKAYAEFGTRRKACEKAGINYNLGVEWEKSGYVSQEELDIASAEYLDTLLDTAHDRAVTGITVNTKDKHGNVYSHAVFNDRVLLRLIEARDKRYQQRQSSTEYNITVNTPAQHIYGSLMGFDTSALNRGVENGGIPMEVFQKFKTEIAPYFEGIMFEITPEWLRQYAIAGKNHSSKATSTLTTSHTTSHTLVNVVNSAYARQSTLYPQLRRIQPLPVVVSDF